MNFSYSFFQVQKKRFSSALLPLLFCWVGPFLAAQNFSPSVVSAGGGRISTSEMSLDWTLGETFADGFSVGSKRFTEGFHQPILKVEIVRDVASEAMDRSATTAEKSTPRNEFGTGFSMQCWPNPTAGTLAARVDSKEWASASFILMTADGQTLQKTEQPTNADFEIQLGECLSGLYFLHFFSPDGQPLGTRKITLIK